MNKIEKTELTHTTFGELFELLHKEVCIHEELSEKANHLSNKIRFKEGESLKKDLPPLLNDSLTSHLLRFVDRISASNAVLMNSLKNIDDAVNY